MMKRSVLSTLNLFSMLALLATAGCAGNAPSPAPTASATPQLAAGILFDDFEYSSQEQMTANGWIVRSELGWPGIPGASWPKEDVTFESDPGLSGNHLLRMTSSTDGTPKNTQQTQICQQRKYYEGTYAARVRFSDTPVSGPDGDQIVETFYMISPQKAPMDPDYSEMDYEYLPNGGWGSPAGTFDVTTWETFQLEPWIADNASDSTHGSLDGWHTLVLQVAGGQVTYYMDGKLLATHGGKYYPEVPMSINFNLWFIQGGRAAASDLRHYSEDIDWVFFQADSALKPQDVEARVTAFRQSGLKFQDTVPANDPPLVSPCNF
jgi:hypothetical protein